MALPAACADFQPRGGSAANAYNPSQAEFREALLHAYHGPVVDFEGRQLPPCFEAEERSDPKHSDILQIVCGR